MGTQNGPVQEPSGYSRPLEPKADLGHTSSISREIIENALGGFYRPEAIMARDIQCTAPCTHEVNFVFPEYKRTLTTLGHVSGVQIQAALFESLYCAVAQAIMDGTFPSTLSLESFRAMRASYFLASQDISFRKMLQEGDVGTIRVKIVSFDDTTGRLTFDVSGIVKGRIVCLRKGPEETTVNDSQGCFDFSASETSRQVLDLALGALYRPESVMARHIQAVQKNCFQVTSVFPAYDRTDSAMPHVSGVQTQAALLESLYGAVAYSILDGAFPATLTMDSFRALRADFILARLDFPVRGKLNPGAAATTMVKIAAVETVKFKRPFHRLSFDIDGSVRGNVECLMEIPVH